MATRFLLMIVSVLTTMPKVFRLNLVLSWVNDKNDIHRVGSGNYEISLPPFHLLKPTKLSQSLIGVDEHIALSLFGTQQDRKLCSLIDM